MRTFSYVLSSFNLYPKFISLLIAKGILELLPFLFLVIGFFILFIGLGANLFDAAMIIVISFIVSIFMLGYIYWYWLLSLAPYIFISNQESKDEQKLGIIRIIFKIFGYPIISNIFLIFIIALLYMIFTLFISFLFQGLIGQLIVSSIFQLNYTLGVIVGIAFVTISNLIYSPLYFIVGFIKFNYINTKKARESLAKGLDMFLSNIIGVIKGVIILTLFNLIFQIVNYIILYLLMATIIPGLVEKLNVLILASIIAGQSQAINLFLMEILPIIIPILIVMFVINFIIHSILELIKLSLIYYVYKKASTKE